MHASLCRALLGGLLSLALCTPARAADRSPEVLARVHAKVVDLRPLAVDPQLVEAVRAYNAAPPAAAQAMTNEAWKGLTVLDPFVRSLAKSPLVEHLKAKKDPAVSELFVSGADGGKVGFFAKTSAWSHKGKAKHEEPMQGRDWIGPVEVDESTGVEQVQVAVPVLDGGRPIGSLVVGLAINKLR